MNNETDRLLGHTNSEMQAIEINDDTLVAGDIHTITSQIAKFPKVHKVVIKGNSLSPDMVLALFQDLNKIPAITDVVIQGSSVSYKDGVFTVSGWQKMSDDAIKSFCAAANNIPDIAVVRFQNCSSANERVGASKGDGIANLLWAPSSLSTIEFINSPMGLNFSFGPTNWKSIIGSNPSLISIHLSEDRSFDSNLPKSGLYKAICAQDHIASLTVPDDPWEYDDVHNGRDINGWLKSSKNLIECRVLEFERTDIDDRKRTKRQFPEKLAVINATCVRNKKQAEHYLARLESATFITEGDLQGIGDYLYSIIYLGDKKHGRKKMVEMLASLNERAAKDLGKVCKTTPFYDHEAVLKQQAEAAAKAEATQKAAAAEAARRDALQKEQARVAAEATARAEAAEAARKFSGEHELDRVILDIPHTKPEDAKKELETITSDVAALRNYGAHLVSLIGQIVPPALQIVTVAPDLDPVTDRLSAFMDIVEEIKLVLQANQDANIMTNFSRSGLVACNRQSVPFPTKPGLLFRRNLDLRDTIDLAKSGDDSLAMCTERLGEIAQLVETQLTVMDKVNSGFGRIETQTSQALIIGHEVLSGMNAKAAAADVTPANMLFTNALQTRLSLLEQTSYRFQNNHSQYIVHQEGIQEASQLISSFLSSEIPLLVATWKTFSSHLSSSFGEEHSTSTHANHLDIAVKEIENIIQQTSAFDETLKVISDKLSEAARNVPNLFPRASVVQTKKAALV